MQTKSILSIKTKIALGIAIFFWSSAFVGTRIGLKGYSPGGLALLRFLIASICMAFVYAWLPKREIFSKKDFGLLILFGAIGLGCYNVFLNYGEMSVSAGIASFIISQAPLLTLIYSFIFLKEKFNVVVLLGIFISIAGVGLITLGHEHTIKLNSGLIYLLLATLVSGLFSVAQKPFLNKYKALDVTIFIIWGGTFSMLIYIPDLLVDIKTAPLSSTLAAVYLGIFPAGIAYFAWSYALATIPASICSTFLYFMPVIATLLGWIFLGEVPALMSLLGGLIALLGVWVANRAFVKGG